MAYASTTIAQDSLTNSPTKQVVAGQVVRPTLKVHSSACITLQAIVVTARHNNNNVGWGGNFNSPRICPSGYTLTPAGKSFAAGTYTEFGAYELNNVWRNLPSEQLVVNPATPTATAPTATPTATAPTTPTATPPTTPTATPPTATPAPAGSSANPQPSWAPNGSFTQTFDDEFNGTSINAGKWDTTWWVNPGNGNGISWSNNTFMTACYAASHDSEPGDGYMHMLLDATPNNCGSGRSYTGAILDSHNHFSQQSYEAEARVYLPCNSSGQVYGWPGWWTIDNTWTGEIDHVEGGWPAAPNGGTASHLEYSDAGGFQNPGWQSSSAYCGWHNLGAAWSTSAKTVTVYWDGVQTFTHAFPVGTGNPEYLIFDYQMASQAIAPPAGGATMLVDWVRVWQ